MIRTLRTLFLARLFREKALIAAFSALAALIWLSSYRNRAFAFFHQVHSTSVNLKEQTLWLSQRTAIEAALHTGSGRLDSAQTLDATRLLAEVTNIADEAGLTSNRTTGEPQDVSNGQFAIHSFVFTANRVDWGTLKAFYTGLQKRSPYISIEQFSIQSDRASPSLHDVNMRISSVEILK